MTKALKNTLLVVPFLAVLAFCVMLLSACGDPTKFTVSDKVKTDTDAVVNSLVTDCYNNSDVLGKKTNYTVAQIKAKITNFNYYVEVGTVENVDKVESISFGNLKFTADQEFYLSIGNSNQIVDKAFYVEEGKLYVAAPIVAFEAIENAKIKINDAEFDFDLDVTAKSVKFTNVAFNAGLQSSATKVSDTEYNLSIKSGTEYVGLYYEGAKADDVIITKRILDGQLNGYGMVKPLNTANGYCSYLYPVGWVEDFSKVNTEKFDGATYDYYVYIIDQGAVANVKLNIDVVTASDSTSTNE